MPGGEHEDFYDPDFCIYNDVFVHERDGSVAIYGYPESVFPPTDYDASDYNQLLRWDELVRQWKQQRAQASQAP
jgi:hypothetical protein